MKGVIWSKGNNFFRNFSERLLAARPGFEPGSKESKSLVLPLHHRASSYLKTYEDLVYPNKWCSS